MEKGADNTELNQKDNKQEINEYGKMYNSRDSG